MRRFGPRHQGLLQCTNLRSFSVRVNRVATLVNLNAGEEAGTRLVVKTPPKGKLQTVNTHADRFLRKKVIISIFSLFQRELFSVNTSDKIVRPTRQVKV